MQIVTATPKELQQLLAAESLMLPIEQSFAWQDFDKKVPGKKPLGVFFAKDGSEVVAVVALTKVSQQGYDWIWAKHGPFFVSKTVTNETVEKTLKALIAHVKNMQKGAVFLRVTTPKVNVNLQPPIHHIMYDRTIVIDITKSDETILANMNRGGRYDLKQSLKKGLEFKEHSGAEAAKKFDAFYAILEETATRDGFRANPKINYVRMLESLGDSVSLYAAYSDDEPVSWAIVTQYAGRGVYYYAAGNALGRKLGAAYGLQLFIMQSLRAKGLSEYDMMGVASPDYPSYSSVTGFKKKFSSNVIDIHKTFDIPLSPKYAVIKYAKKLKEAVRK